MKKLLIVAIAATSIAGCASIKPQPKCAYLVIHTGEWHQVECDTLGDRIKLDNILN